MQNIVDNCCDRRISITHIHRRNCFLTTLGARERESSLSLKVASAIGRETRGGMEKDHFIQPVRASFP